MYHGFTDYMRDYELVVYATADPRTGIRPQHVRLLFKHCVRAAVTSTLTPEIWSRSMDELLVEAPGDEPVEGYAWGVRWQVLYPGLSLLGGSVEADRWSVAIGIPFYEARAVMNGHSISLVFADLSKRTVEAGYSPFVVPAAGPGHKFPLA